MLQVSLNRDAVFNLQRDRDFTTSLRDELFNKFSRMIISLQESRKPKRTNSRRGLLNTRKLYRHQIDDQIFYKNPSIPSSDTTFVFLIDTSGSMSYDRNINKANAVVSAFAKANHLLMNDSLKMEVFTKGTPGINMNSYVKGSAPVLSRVYSNSCGKKDYDRLMNLSLTSPFETSNGSGRGNYTPEYLLLPALMSWCKKNITTRNMVIINITDGSVQHIFNNKTFARDDDTKTLRIKYLRGIPNVTLFVGNYRESALREMYGNVVGVDSESFANKFMAILQDLISEYA